MIFVSKGFKEKYAFLNQIEFPSPKASTLASQMLEILPMLLCFARRLLERERERVCDTERGRWIGRGREWEWEMETVDN